MHYSKKICAIGLAIILGPLAFGYNPVYLPNHPGSRKAHKQLTAKVFEMLRTKQYTAAKKFLDSIPPCPKGIIRKVQIPAYCAGQSDYGLEEADLQEPNYIYRNYKLNTVYPPNILIDALAKHYHYLYGNNPYDAGKFDKEKSVNFYDTYKYNTWLEPIVRENLFKWPHVLNIENKPWKYEFGAELYDRITLAKALGLPLATGYTQCYDPDFEEVKLILDGAWSRAVKMGDKNPFHFIKYRMSEYILDPARHARSRATFSHGALYLGRLGYLVNLVSALGAEDANQAKKAWDIVLIKPFTKKMKDNAQKLSDVCFKHQGSAYVKSIWCINFKKRAQDYGLIAPDIKTVRQEIRDRVNTPGIPFIFPK